MLRCCAAATLQQASERACVPDPQSLCAYLPMWYPELALSSLSLPPPSLPHRALAVLSCAHLGHAAGPHCSDCQNHSLTPRDRASPPAYYGIDG